MTKTYNDIENLNVPLVTRLRTQMVRKGLNPKTLAENANVGRSFVYDILSGRSCNPTSGKIAAIADELGVSMQYLLTGTHSQSSSFQQSWADVVEISALCVESSASESIIVSKDQFDKDYYYSETWIRDFLHAEPKNLRSFKIACDSMYPTLKAGDNILVDLSKKHITTPNLYLLFDGVELKPRRLEIATAAKIIIRSDNDKNSGFEAALEDLNIIGKIIWVGRSL